MENNMLYKPKYNPKSIIEDLNNNNVDLEKFENIIKRLNNGSVFNQQVFEFVYESLVINKYNTDIF